MKTLARQAAEHGARAAAVCCLVWSNHRPSGCDVRGLPDRRTGLSGGPQNSPPITKGEQNRKRNQQIQTFHRPHLCAQVCGERRLYTVAAHASRPPAATDLTLWPPSHPAATRPCPCKVSRQDTDTTSVNIILPCSEQHGDGATPPDRIQCPLAHDTHCCTLLPLAVRHRAMLRHCRQNPMNSICPSAALIQPSHPGIRA